MSQSSGFDPKAFSAIQMCAAFRFLFFFSSAIFSFLLIGTVGTGLSLEQQLAGGVSRAGRGWHRVWCAGASELCPAAPRGHCWHWLTRVRGAVWVWLVAECQAGSGEVGLPMRTLLDGMLGGLLAADGAWFTAAPLFSVVLATQMCPLP